jgi:S1-C subfamily serine protease
MERLVISPAEVAGIKDLPIETAGPPASLPPAIPWWAKICISPLALVLPVLCILSIIIRVVTRNLAPRIRYAWMSFLLTLLAVSGLLTSIAVVVAVNLSPTRPSILSQGLSELDGRTSFPSISIDHALSAEEIAANFKPLVTVITPVRRSWFSKSDSPSAIFGAGVLLDASKEGYLIATARHVIDSQIGAATGGRVLIASTSGTWAASDVVARHRDLDLALLWLPRITGNATFSMHVANNGDIKDGAPIFVIGHPQGLRFTLSTGIVSRKGEDTIQITAPVSPGNSGGPLLDARGQLAGIVTSMIDRSRSPNSEELNFAVPADALLDISKWNFSGEGRRHLSTFEQNQHSTLAQKEN